MVGVGRALAGVLGEVVAGGLQLAVLVQLRVDLAAVVRGARRGRPAEGTQGLGAVGQRGGGGLGGSVGAPPAAEDAVHLVVVLADLAGVPVLLQPVPGLVVLPLEALDADAALLRGALEAQLGQAARHVPVHMAVAKVAVQRRLHVCLPPDLQQRPRLQVRPEEAPRVGDHPRPAGVTAMAARRGEEGREREGRRGGGGGGGRGLSARSPLAQGAPAPAPARQAAGSRAPGPASQPGPPPARQTFPGAAAAVTCKQGGFQGGGIMGGGGVQK